MAGEGTSGGVRGELEGDELTAEQQQQRDWIDRLVTAKVEAAKAALAIPESSTPAGPASSATDKAGTSGEGSVIGKSQNRHYVDRGQSWRAVSYSRAAIR